MIKLVQGFDIGSPLPIDGRILLSSNEMKEISDYYLPERYFAINRDDGRLYLYNKNNAWSDSQETDQKKWFGKFRLADEATYKLLLGDDWPDLIKDDSEIAQHGSVLETVEDEIAEEVSTLNSRISDEVVIINDRIDDEVETINETVDTKESALQQEDARLNSKIDNYKTTQNLVNFSELNTALLPYSEIAATGRNIKVNSEVGDDDFIFSVSLLDVDGNELSRTANINLPLEKMVVDADYDEETKTIILHVLGPQSGEVKDIEVPIGDLINGLVSEATFNSHVDNHDVHIVPTERSKWNNMADNAVSAADFANHLAPGNNVSLSTEDTITTINAINTTYGEGIGITISSTDDPDYFLINSEASAPYWANIQGSQSEGTGPLSNVELSNAFSTKVNNSDFINFQSVDYANFKSETNEKIAAVQASAGNAETSINAEIGQRVAADNAINARITSEETARTTADNTLTTNLNNEVSRATAAESTLDGKITSESERAQTAESNLSDAIGAEETRATGVENGLDERLTEVESDIDKVVITNLEAFEQYPDKIKITHDNVNIKTGSTSFETHHLPLADTLNAGLMAPADVSSIANLKERVETLEGRTKRYLYQDGTDPTAEEINAFAIGLGLSAPFEGVAIVIDQTYHIWHYYQNTARWQDDGPDVVHSFNNETPGVILGAAVEGKVYAENDGTGSVYGWDDLTDVVEGLANNKADASWVTNQLDTKVDKVTNYGLIKTSEAELLLNVANGATKVEDSATNGYIKVTSRANGGSATSKEVEVYDHPVGNDPSAAEGFYKISTDDHSHVASTVAVTAADISGLNPYLPGDGLEAAALNGQVTFNETFGSITVAANDWGSSGSWYYTVTKNFTGMKATSHPVLDLDTSGAESADDLTAMFESWSKVYKAESDDGSIKLYASEVPAVALVISVKGY